MTFAKQIEYAGIPGMMEVLSRTPRDVESEDAWAVVANAPPGYSFAALRAFVAGVGREAQTAARTLGGDAAVAGLLTPYVHPGDLVELHGKAGSP